MHVSRLAAERMAAPGPPADASALPPINVGCSGWFYWHWRGAFYPAGVPTSRWFEHYRRYFKTVELNAPFYSWPTESVVASWLRQAGRTKFIYTVKVSELITHTRRFAGTKTLVRDFGYIADLLGKRMGCFLFQLPPSFHYSRPGSGGSSSSLILPAVTSSNSATKAGGTTMSTMPSARAGRSSVPAAGHDYPTSWSRPPTRSIYVFTAQPDGIGTTTRRLS